MSVKPPSSEGATSKAPTQQISHGLPTPPDDVGFADAVALIDSADSDFQKYQDKRAVKVLNKAGMFHGKSGWQVDFASLTLTP